MWSRLAHRSCDVNRIIFCSLLYFSPVIHYEDGRVMLPYLRTGIAAALLPIRMRPAGRRITGVLTQFCSAVSAPSFPVTRFEPEFLARHFSQVVGGSAMPQPVSQPTRLPRLPVPPLKHTLDKYLRSVKPLVTPDEYRNTEQIVQKFGGPNGVGEKLQELLTEKAKDTENWLQDWWLHVSYLDFRWPVVVYSSPGLVFPLQEFQSSEDQLKYAAKMVAGALDYKRLIDHQLIPQEMMGSAPLDMSQYNKIFGTCRIPGVNHDSLTFHPDSSHIIVCHNNHYFKLNVYEPSGTPITVAALFSALKKIVSESRERAVPVGVLTAENRNAWGKTYKRLLGLGKHNQQVLRELEKSLFVLCLDQPNPKYESLNKQTVAALQTVHGGGSAVNGGNRWFDKTVQLIVGTEGEVGLTYEHSPSEGPPIANMMDHVVDYAQKTSDSQLKSPATSVPQPEKLHFQLSAEVEEDIEKAKENLDGMVRDLEMSCFTFVPYGKRFIKSQKLSPDSYIQMAIQLAFYRIHKELGATYESASTRMFLHGRTETIRSASVEALDFCKAMLDNSVSAEQKITSLRTAINEHKKYAVDAISGKGVDRHLLGLKLLAIEEGFDVPAIFLDTSYTHSSHFRLSTSQVPAKCDSFMCYGPLVPNGYGCCYNPREDEMNFGVSAFNSSPETYSATFRDALQQSLIDMHNVLASSQKAKL